MLFQSFTRIGGPLWQIVRPLSAALPGRTLELGHQASLRCVPTRSLCGSTLLQRPPVLLCAPSASPSFSSAGQAGSLSHLVHYARDLYVVVSRSVYVAIRILPPNF